MTRWAAGKKIGVKLREAYAGLNMELIGNLRLCSSAAGLLMTDLYEK